MDRQASLADLGRLLMTHDYRFVTPAPETHKIVNGRKGNEAAKSLTDIFGWSRPFSADVAGRRIVDLLESADALRQDGDLLKSAVRFSTLGPLLIVHSAFPTSQKNAVFFGPDTYRTCRAMRAELAADVDFKPDLVVDVGAGAGAIGLYAASLLAGARVVLADIMPEALRMSEINAELNGISNVDVRHSDLLANVAEAADLIVSNPPFMSDPQALTYRDGGGEWGTDIARRIVGEALGKLSPNGKLMLYTGTPVIDGIDVFARSLEGVLDRDAWSVSYAEVDPDIFPEELQKHPYDKVDRIAAVFLVAGRAALKTAQ